MKGKKFSAAEKHFNEMAQKEKSELKKLRLEVIRLTEKSKQDDVELERLTKLSGEQAAQILELQKCVGLSDEDIKVIVSRARTQETFGKVLESFIPRGYLG